MTADDWLRRPGDSTVDVPCPLAPRSQLENLTHTLARIAADGVAQFLHLMAVSFIQRLSDTESTAQHVEQ
jgi:hypothetical protein